MTEPTPSPTPQSALHEVFYGNDCFVQMRDPKHFEHYESSQHPSVTMLTCCDSRMHQLVFNFDPIDRTFVVQNIGNQLQFANGSIDYGIHHLKTPLLLITGHTRCGAIAAAMQDYSNESNAIVRELNGLHLPLFKIPREGDSEANWMRAVEANVDFQVSRAMRRYESLVETGTLTIAGCIYDFADLYGKGRGRLLLINLNGEQNHEAILASSALQSLDASLRDSIVCDRASVPV